MTVYQRIAKVNDYVCDRITYDYEALLDHANANVTSLEPYQSYGALFNGKAVCQGYTQLTDMLFKEIGYECI